MTDLIVDLSSESPVVQVCVSVCVSVCVYVYVCVCVCVCAACAHVPHLRYVRVRAV